VRNIFAAFDEQRIIFNRSIAPFKRYLVSYWYKSLGEVRVGPGSWKFDSYKISGLRLLWMRLSKKKMLALYRKRSGYFTMPSVVRKAREARGK
jgi:hypothetical protein